MRKAFSPQSLVPVNSCEQLYSLANGGRAVITNRGVRMPAAFVISMQCRCVVEMISQGLYVYPRKWTAPKALMTEGLQSWDAVTWDGNFSVATYVKDAFGGLAYIFTRGGSAFIEKERLIRSKTTH